MLQVGLNEDAGREIYLACFHAARALIFERTDKVAKTHRGVQSEFYRRQKEMIVWMPSYVGFFLEPINSSP
jgi:uncharacterized protein (UPF0332 family)